jgi:hypothetical protein
VVARRSPNGPDLLVLKRAKSTEIESSQIETTIATAGAADGSAQSIFGDVEIEFVEETGLVTIRGSKEDVSRTLGVIHTIRAQEKSASKP